MKYKRPRFRTLASLLLSLSSIVLLSLPASAGVSTDSNPGSTSGAGGTGTIDLSGGTIYCGNPLYITTTFSLCHDTAGDTEAVVTKGGSKTANGYQLCPTGFTVWRFYSESSAPGTVEGYSISRAYQIMDCHQTAVTGLFTTPDHADTGSPETPAFISSSSPEFPSTSDNGAGVGGTVYSSAIDPNAITTNATEATYGASCASLESAGNTAAVDAVFKAMAAGTATDSQTAFANGYWNDYISGEGSNVVTRNYLMNLNPNTPNLTNETTAWTTLAQDYGAGVPACSSAYQFIPPSTGLDQTNGVEGVCTMPVDVSTQEWENVTKTLATGKTVTIYNQLSDTSGGNRYVAQTGSNSTVPGSGAVEGSGSPAATSTGFFATWRADIATSVENQPLTVDPTTGATYYAGSPYSGIQNFLPLGSPQDRSQAAAVASGDADCTAFTSSIPAVDSTTTTTSSTTTTTKPPSTTTTTAPYIPPPSTGPSMTITPKAPVLSAGGALHPNKVTVTIGPFSCNGASCDPDGIGPATLSSVTATPKITATGNYQDFWIDGSPNEKPTSDGNGEYSFTLPAATSVGPHTYTIDFAYATTPNQSVTFKVDSASAVYLVWLRVVVGDPCSPTPASGSPPTTSEFCTPIYGNRQFAYGFTPTVEPASITKVVSGTVTPKN
jgi:hypothetical protein